MSSETPTEHPHITRNPKICGGSPRLQNSRITVRLIAEMWKGGASVEDIVKTYPHLQPSWVYDAISYYLDFLATVRIAPRCADAASPAPIRCLRAFRRRAQSTRPRFGRATNQPGRLSDLTGKPLLDLEPAGEDLHQPRQLREPKDSARRDIGDVSFAEERQEVVLAE